MSHWCLARTAAACILWAALLCPPNRPALSRAGASVPPKASPQVPVGFEPNRGQASPDAEFTAHTPAYTVELSRATALIAVDDGAARVSLAGARLDVAAEGVDPRAGTVNYFIGNEPSRWLTGVPTYAQVRYRDVYPGVDLAFHAAQQELEYDFIVQPGGDPRQIRLAFDGTERVELDATGDLLMSVGRHYPPIRHRRPCAFQIGRRTAGARGSPS